MEGTCIVHKPGLGRLRAQSLHSMWVNRSRYSAYKVPLMQTTRVVEIVNLFGREREGVDRMRFGYVFSGKAVRLNGLPQYIPRAI